MDIRAKIWDSLPNRSGAMHAMGSKGNSERGSHEEGSRIRGNLCYFAIAGSMWPHLTAQIGARVGVAESQGEADGRKERISHQKIVLLLFFLFSCR